MKSFNPIRCLILACGNTLRGDDGVGPALACWAEDRFRAEPAVRIVSRQQWTPELSEDIARAQSVIFIDCSIAARPGSVNLLPVEPALHGQAAATHHLGACELIALAQLLYGNSPEAPLLLTIGACSTELGEHLSPEAQSALLTAQALLEETVLRRIGE